jgi:hypothetical protein
MHPLQSAMHVLFSRALCGTVRDCRLFSQKPQCCLEVHHTPGLLYKRLKLLCQPHLCHQIGMIYVFVKGVGIVSIICQSSGLTLPLLASDDRDLPAIVASRSTERWSAYEIEAVGRFSASIVV